MRGGDRGNRQEGPYEVAEIMEVKLTGKATLYNDFVNRRVG